MNRAFPTPALVFVLIILGAGWGISLPLTKIAVSTGYQPLGVLFWQLLISALLLGAINWARGKRLPTHRAALRIYVIIAFIGTLFPQTASLIAYAHLPGGLMALFLSLVPIFAFPIALILGNDQFDWIRLGGLFIGLIAVSLIILPDTSLPDRSLLIFVPLALVAPLFYGFEGNFVAKWGTAGLDPIQVLTGASILGLIIVSPAALVSGQWFNLIGPLGAPEIALILFSLIHGLVYSGYVWLVGQAGSVFAAQVSYLVTGFGVLGSILILGERYAVWVWLAMGLMFVGMALVRPRRPDALEPSPLSSDNVPTTDGRPAP